MEISDIILNKKQLALLNRESNKINFLLDDLNYLYGVRDDTKNAGNYQHLEHVEKVIRSDEKWLYGIYKKALASETSRSSRKNSNFYLEYKSKREEKYSNFEEFDFLLDSLSKLYKGRDEIIKKGTFDQEYNKKRKENFLKIRHFEKKMKVSLKMLDYFGRNQNDK